MDIWRDNETLTYVTPRGISLYPDIKEKLVSLVFIEEKAIVLRIGGKTDEDVAQTAAFWMGLEEPTEEKTAKRTPVSFSNFQGSLLIFVPLNLIV